MENLIKNSTVDRNNILNEIKKQLEKYRPLKCELDSMLQGIGLPAAKGLDLEDFNVATNEYVLLSLLQILIIALQCRSC